MADETLPAPSQTVRFGDVVRHVKETAKDPASLDIDRVVGLDHLDPGSLAIRRWDELGDLPDGTSFTRIFHSGQVLFGKRRAYQRKVAVATFDGVCSGDILVFEPAGRDLLPEFLPYVVQSEAFFDHALGTSAGSLSPRTKWQDLAKFEFLLPSLEDQRDFSELLRQVDAALDSFGELLSASSRMVEAVTAALYEQSTESRVSLGSVAHVQYGLTLGPKRSALAGSAPYLRVANVQRGSLDLAEIKRVGVTAEDVRRYALSSGDLLVVEGHASNEEVGRAAMWAGAPTEPLLHQNHLIRVRCGPQLRPRLALALLDSGPGRRYFRANAKSTSGLHTINSTIVKQFPVPMVDEKDQLATEDTLVALDQLSMLTLTHRARLSDLRVSLLNGDAHSNVQ